MVNVKDSLTCLVNNSVKTNMDSESVLVDVYTGKEKLTVGVLYRPPNLNRQDTSILLQKIGRVSRGKNVWIMGDFNYRNTDWEDLVGDLESEDLEVIQDHFLKH